MDYHVRADDGRGDRVEQRCDNENERVLGKSSLSVGLRMEKTPHAELSRLSAETELGH